ncbi:hypothetical protein P5673_016117 [Acropora cervicornis]|uniref:Uncharacterized protein n=1 Tax=Acropora cervicornis TaxID=6130 RepID=A0AAD9QHE3_ACRCE|nr:hypothetical protein P5673_016117 [Acropora cervicornis]
MAATAQLLKLFSGKRKARSFFGAGFPAIFLLWAMFSMLDMSVLQDCCNRLAAGIVIGYKNSRIVPGKTTISETSFVFFNVDICDILYFYCGTTVSYSIKYNHYSLSLILWKLKYSL